MRYNRNLSLADAAWIQYRIISMLLRNFVYRRRWYARKARGHINPHKVSEIYHTRIGLVADRSSTFYGYLCRTDPYDVDRKAIIEEQKWLRSELNNLKANPNTDTDFQKFKSTWKKVDDELKILEGHEGLTLKELHHYE